MLGKKGLMVLVFVGVLIVGGLGVVVGGIIGDAGVCGRLGDGQLGNMDQVNKGVTEDLMLEEDSYHFAQQDKIAEAENFEAQAKIAGSNTNYPLQAKLEAKALASREEAAALETLKLEMAGHVKAIADISLTASQIFSECGISADQLSADFLNDETFQASDLEKLSSEHMAKINGDTALKNAFANKAGFPESFFDGTSDNLFNIQGGGEGFLKYSSLGGKSYMLSASEVKSLGITSVKFADGNAFFMRGALEPIVAKGGLSIFPANQITNGALGNVLYVDKGVGVFARGADLPSSFKLLQAGADVNIGNFYNSNLDKITPNFQKYLSQNNIQNFVSPKGTFKFNPNTGGYDLIRAAGQGGQQGSLLAQLLPQAIQGIQGLAGAAGQGKEEEQGSAGEQGNSGFEPRSKEQSVALYSYVESGALTEFLRSRRGYNEASQNSNQETQTT